MGAMSPQNGEQRLLRSPQSKIDTIKNWSISTYKCTKQMMFEKLGKTSRTVDTGGLVDNGLWCVLLRRLRGRKGVL
jgi:hypothetical protein